MKCFAAQHESVRGTFPTCLIGPMMSAIGGEADKSRPTFGLWIFGPPFGPSDLVRCASGLHDDSLIGGTEWPGEAGQRCLDEPRFEHHPRSLAIGIELPGHSQRFVVPQRASQLTTSVDIRVCRS